MEELMLKKSIFKQKQINKEYYKGYEVGEKPSIWLNERDIDLNKTYTYECELPMPLLVKGESFYIEEDDKIVRIKRATRTSKDNVLYECDPLINYNYENRDKLKIEVKQESMEWDNKHPEVKGIRKFIKNLFR